MLFRVLRWLNSQEQLIPLMMFARGTGTPARKLPTQQMSARDRWHIEPSPVRKTSATGTADLIPKQLDGTMEDSIIVWLDDSRLPFITELN